MLINDQMATAVEYALGGLALRADVRAHNIANQNTPGFRAARVDFESVLQGALAQGAPERAAAPAMGVDPSLPGPNQNTVNLENELIGLMKDNLMREAMVNAFNFKTDVTRTAITSR